MYCRLVIDPIDTNFENQLTNIDLEYKIVKDLNK